MRTVRSRLFALSLIAMLGQLAGTVAASTALLGMNFSTTASDEGTVCTCPHAADGECPMHKHKPAAPDSSRSSAPDGRWCAGSSDHRAVVLTTLFIGGPLAARHAGFAPALTTARIALVFAAPSSLALPLASPPPRV